MSRTDQGLQNTRSWVTHSWSPSSPAGRQLAGLFDAKGKGTASLPNLEVDGIVDHNFESFTFLARSCRESKDKHDARNRGIGGGGAGVELSRLHSRNIVRTSATFVTLLKSLQLNNTIRGSSSDGESRSSARIRTHNGKTLVTPRDRRALSSGRARAHECRHHPRSRFRTELRRDVADGGSAY